ncbi:MAG: hypothetical protein PHP35_01730 [Candidatus Colwellbacteria bacterium]|nr:hypothetical protein [Candidatus Colwellbacteria bacterium]
MKNKDYLKKEFACSHRDNEYKWKFGRTIASSLSGFIAGVVFASIGWGVVLYLFSLNCK